VTEQATDEDWAAVGDFAADLRTKAIRDRLNELGFDGTSGDVVVVCPPGSAPQSSAGDAHQSARWVLLAAQDDSELGWAMMWADDKEAR
jgi:hypothetical protein